MLKKSSLLFLSFFYLGCSSGLTNKSSKNIPDWISRQPKDNSFWYGIGVSNIGSNDPRQTARQRAFSEIAEQLKVDIKSSLTDVMQASNNNFEEFSKSIIETRVDASLEYVENVDSYRDSKRQYVLARLDKNQYFDKIKRKKDEAKQKAEGLINKSINQMTSNSLSNISLAMESIHPYVDLFPKIDDPYTNGKRENIMVIAEKMIRKYNDDIELSFTPSKVSAKAFVDNGKKVVIVANSKSKSSNVANLRLLIRLNDDATNDFIILDKSGKAVYQLSRLEAPSGNHSLIFSLDYQSMMSKKALELVSVIPREYSLDISIEAPKIYFDGNVSNLGKKVKNSPIYSSLKECLEDNYSSVFVNSKMKADILLNLEVMTEERAARLGENFPYFVYSVGSISMKNQKTKEEILNSRFKDMKGADFSSKEKAGFNALKKLSQNMNIDICD